MTGYQFSVDCPKCGGHLEHVNGTPGCGTQAVAVASCRGCRSEWMIEVLLRPLRPLEQKDRRRLVAS